MHCNGRLKRSSWIITGRRKRAKRLTEVNPFVRSCNRCLVPTVQRSYQGKLYFERVQIVATDVRLEWDEADADSRRHLVPDDENKDKSRYYVSRDFTMDAREQYEQGCPNWISHQQKYTAFSF